METKRVFSGFIWRFLERVGAQGVELVVSLVLARLLEPSVYGIVALVYIFTGILQVFVDSGLGNALIQKKDADDLDFSSVFFFNLFVCFILYLLLFFSAPLIAQFYAMPDLVSVIRVMSLILIISGVKNIQQAYISKNMLFRKFFFATLGGTIGAAILGIILAIKGFGVWALVAQNLLNATVDTIILWITVKWRPKFIFSFNRLRALLSYAWKLLASSLLDKVYTELRSLIIGKLYTADDLAFYNKGRQFPYLLVSNINTSINSVLLPTMSEEQDNICRVRAMTRRSIKTSTYIMMPMMAGLAACAEPLIRLLLTEKWLPAVPFLRIACLTYAFYTLHTTNLNAIKALGRSDIFLKLEIAKKIVGLLILVITMWNGVLFVAYFEIVSSFASQIINSWPNKRLLDYSYLDQIKDMLPQIVLSIIMGCTVYSIQLIGLSDIITLSIQIPIGVAIFFVGSIVFKIETFNYLIRVLKSYSRAK